MLKGGYQVLDLKDIELTFNVGHVYPGIYEQIEGTRKAILLSGYNPEGDKMRDTWVYVEIDGSKYKLTDGYTVQVTINDNDVVTAIEI